MEKKSSVKQMRLTLIFFLMVSLATAISVIARKSGNSLAGLQNLLTFVMLLLVGWFGWLLVRRCSSGLARNILLGLILSIGSHWSLPLFHKGGEILQLLIINSAIFALATFLGGLFAVLFYKNNEAKNRNNDHKK